MAASVKSSGSQACTVDTEHTLLATTDAGTYQLVLDLNPAVDGDAFEVRVKAPVLSGGTIRVVWAHTYYDAQATDDKVAVSVPLMCPHGATFTLKQVAGTSRTIPWSVNQP
jgi:hypothetical protein